MPGSWGSQCIAWSDIVDSSSSNLEHPQSWSNLTDSDHANALDSQPPSVSVQVFSRHSWSPCPSWSTSDWSSCLPWSLLDDNSGQEEESEAESLQSCLSSQPSNKCDKDYQPGSTFTSLMPAPKFPSESNASDKFTQPSGTVGVLQCILSMH